MKLNNKLAKYSGLLLLIVLLIVLPRWVEYLIVNGIFGMRFGTIFSYETWLSFIISYIGAIVTILALIITIRYNNKVIKNSFVSQKIMQKCEAEKLLASQVLDLVLLTKYEMAEQRGRDWLYPERLKYDIIQIDSLIKDRYDSEYYALVKELTRKYESIIRLCKPSNIITLIEAQEAAKKVDELIVNHSEELHNLLNKWIEELQDKMYKQILKLK